ncbi:MAG: AI-2E family transporter [Rubripirellula sp.]|nr:AI-2E family transporter [Rubripirellula sp.]
MASDSARSFVEPARSLLGKTWWRKPLIWGTLLLLLSAMREFFLIGFLTFLICFVVRSIVRRVVRRVSPEGDSRWLDLSLTLAVLLGVIMVLYGLGRYFVPQLVRQGNSLLAQVQDSSSEQVLNTLLANTVGAWKFEREYGGSDDERYQKAQQEFQDSGRYGEGLYQEFPKLTSRLQAEFEANYEQARAHHLRFADPTGTAAEASLKQWFLVVKAPELFHDKSEYYLARWEAEYTAPEKAEEFANLKKLTDFESRRDAQIRERIWEDIRADPVLLSELNNQWTRVLSLRSWETFRNSPDYQAEFEKFFEAKHIEEPRNVPVDFEYYEKLAAVYPQGIRAFTGVVRQHEQESKGTAVHHQFDFESATRAELGRQWWATSHVADWVRDHAANDGPVVMESVLQRLDQWAGHLIRIPVQVVTALLLAFLILVEWHGLTTGIASLRNSRVQPIIDEVAPGIVALGKLIGRSFQGQVIISVVNAILVLFSLWVIGVEYKFVLTLLVFVSSFIPVVGVVLSGIPICVIAILQPEGSLLMALQVILAIVLIHFFEAMVLAPRIIGKLGSLNPVVVVVILLVAEHFFGMWGLLLGVPVSIYILRVVILRSSIPGIYEPRIETAGIETAGIETAEPAGEPA